MPSKCASISTISWRRKRRQKRRKLPQPKPSPRRLARRPLQPDLSLPLQSQSLPRSRKPLRRHPQVAQRNQPLPRPLLQHREPFRRDRRLLLRLLLMLHRLPRIRVRILLRLQNPALLPLRPLLRHPQLRQGPVRRLLSDLPRPHDPQAPQDKRVRLTRSGLLLPLPASDPRARVLLHLHNDILRAPAVHPERDRGVRACHRVIVPVAAPVVHRVPAVRSVPADPLPDFRSVRGIAPIKAR